MRDVRAEALALNEARRAHAHWRRAPVLERPKLERIASS